MLYRHNQITYDKVLKELTQYKKCAIVQATGTGKTFITEALLGSIFAGKKVAYIVPTESIAEGIRLYGGNFKDVDFMCYSGLRSCKPYEVVIFDELHRLGANTWGRWAKTLADSAEYTLGLTATPIRYLDSNRDMAKEIFGEHIVFGPNIETAIQEGILNGFNYYAILGDVLEYVEEIHKYGRDREVQKRLRGLNLSEYNLAERIKKYIPNTPKAIAFFSSQVDLENADYNLKKWLGDSINIYSIHSKQSLIENKKNIVAFNEDIGSCVIKAVDMLNEGVHIEGVNTLIFARKTASGNVFLQQLGRGLRSDKSAGKTTVIDIVENFRNTRVLRSAIKSVRVVKGESKGDAKALIDTRKIVISYDDILLELEDVLASAKQEWTEEEDNILKKYYPTDGSTVSKRLRGKTVQECSRRAKVLGLTRPRSWTHEEDEILRNNYSDKDVWRLLPGRTELSIRTRIRVLGLVNKWTAEEDLLLMKYWESHGTDICKDLSKHTVTEIIERAKKLGLC